MAERRDAMTIEEKAHELITKIFSLPQPGPRDRQILAPLIMEALRDQIEECARVGDEQAAFHKSEADRLSKNEDAANCERTGEHASERIAARIRALATPKEKGKENVR